MARWRPPGIRAEFVVSGRDAAHDGTWYGRLCVPCLSVSRLAVGADGRFAAVTNNREEPVVQGAPLSRGQLVLDLFRSDSVAAYTDYLAGLPRPVPNANFVYGDVRSGELCWFGVYPGGRTARRLTGDPFVIANGRCEANWPKATEGRRLFAAAVGGARTRDGLIAALWGLLSNSERHTGVPGNTVLSPAEEAAVSSIFVPPAEIKTMHSDVYATLSSTIVLVGHDGTVECLEKTWLPTGCLVREQFHLAL